MKILGICELSAIHYKSFFDKTMFRYLLKKYVTRKTRQVRSLFTKNRVSCYRTYDNFNKPSNFLLT